MTTRHPAHEAPQRIALHPGSPLWLRVRRGDTLLATHAPVELIGPPWWLAERWIERRVRLMPEEPHTVDRTGWIGLQAAASTELLHHAAAPRPGRPWRYGALRPAR